MDNNLIQADVFFFVSTILLSVLSLLFIVAIIYVLKILKEARAIAALVRGEAEKVSRDIANLREKIMDKGPLTGGVLAAVAHMFMGKGRKGRKK